MKTLIRIVIVLVGIIVVVLGRWFFFDSSGFYTPPPSEMPSYEKFIIPSAPTTAFTDNHTQGEGIILIDRAHKNDFDKKELNVLLLRLVSRGLTIKYLDAGDDLKKELLAKVEEPPDGQVKVEPEEELKPADAFIVVSPSPEFSKEEIKTVEEFVKGGGKLLLIADPTRSSQINSLAIRFGLIFESDYLYNMKENEINYRNIFVSEFKENDITKELGKIALYTAGSISSANSSIAFVDENTFSSVIETRGKLAPIALAQESKVLAIYDLTFMTEPYNGTLDNNRLISNIADWLMPPAQKMKAK